MLKYIKPQLNIIVVNTADVISTSELVIAGDPFAQMKSGWLSVLDGMGVVDTNMKQKIRWGAVRKRSAQILKDRCNQ